ncbi:DEAD/DEAH box helicase [Microlunatus soli]|uniref:Superfamily II RNA helicase n=1 Tax=Microlunatus soli TaxID=630515 RepID=A0A1H1T9Y5_9ACTN|nr:DEAD/DEAH box helicase [Microlunatus soli]SDS57060.1 Superfamily II RNA helicase [Microlunatus soli]
MTLTDLLPASADPDDVFGAFTDWATDRGLSPYPAQEDALIELVSGSNVILATPTGSGKSLVATGLEFAVLAARKAAEENGRPVGRVFYTAPIKALVSEKFFAATEIFGHQQVGMMTGDAGVNTQAPIICCTAEILANMALRDGRDADVAAVIMDEFHYYADPQRGWAWQVPLIELPQAQFLLMSATLGDVTRFADDLERRTGRTTTVVASAERPVPLHYEYVTTTLHETITERLETHQTPIYVVHFSRAAAIEQAQALTSLKVCSREEKDRIAELIGNFRFSSGFGKTLSRLVRNGVGVHHAGMLPRYRRLVERLSQAGLLKIICGTDTLGVGINVPIRIVLLTSLSKYDGERPRLLTAREFHQIAGRAGRAGYDTSGTVIVQAPDHVVANEKALAKAGDDPKKRRKVVKKKPPPGTVGYGEPTFDRLVAADPEPLESSFAVSNAMLLNVINRPGDCMAAMHHLLTTNDEPPQRRRRHIRRALAIYRGLRRGGIVEQSDEPDELGRRARLTVELQPDFALNQPLSPFALAAFELLDRESASYPLDVISIIEATLDDPRPILSAQRNRARGEAVAEMKAEGLEYEERMERLDDVTHPQPLADLLLPAYRTYLQTHPWLADTELSPKSVIREMAEQAMNFSEFVASYRLARSEGMVLRYLADGYRALRQTVPEEAKTGEVQDLIEWLGEVVRQTDSSLLEEWEELAHPELHRVDQDGRSEVDYGPPPVTGNVRAFRVLVRNALFRRVELCAREDWEALADMDGDRGWNADVWADAIEPYFDDHDEIGLGPDARGPAMLIMEQAGRRWTVRQIFDDPEGDHDWGFSAVVDLDASDVEGVPVITVTGAGRLDAV